MVAGGRDRTADLGVMNTTSMPAYSTFRRLLTILSVRSRGGDRKSFQFEELGKLGVLGPRSAVAQSLV
jgi:hypothetical protein